MLVFGSELSFELQDAKNPQNPFHSQDFANKQSFALLQSMLIAERWLTEFLLGPSKSKVRKKTDICVDCFRYDWRFPEGSLAEELAERRDRIHKLALHPTWELVDLGARTWTLNRIRRCAEGLEIFAAQIKMAHPAVAEEFTLHTKFARVALLNGRSDGSRWFVYPSSPEIVAASDVRAAP